MYQVLNKVTGGKARGIPRSSGLTVFFCPQTVGQCRQVANRFGPPRVLVEL
jgi:hypothetical protein